MDGAAELGPGARCLRKSGDPKHRAEEATVVSEIKQVGDLSGVEERNEE